MRSRFVVALLLACSYAQDWACAGIIAPAGLNPGDQFRVILYTGMLSGVPYVDIDTRRTDVGYYDARVQSFVDAYGAGTFNGQSVSFQAIASTATVNANDPGRLSLTSDVPIYDYWRGVLVADNGADFWSGSLPTGIGPGGVGGALVLTGTDQFGNRAFQGPFGRYFGTTSGGVSRRIAWGSSNGSNHEWVFAGSTQSKFLSLYGYSEVLTVPGLETPEPGSLTLLGLGSLGLLGFARRRRFAD